MDTRLSEINNDASDVKRNSPYSVSQIAQINIIFIALCLFTLYLFTWSLIFLGDNETEILTLMNLSKFKIQD